SHRVICASRLVQIPESLEDTVVAGMLVRGLTVLMLTTQVRRICPGDLVLVQAAAGGVGQVLVRYATALGAHVIGTVGSENKAATARAAGCTDVVLYRTEPLHERVKAITAGRGVQVVYDSVGRDTFEGSLSSLRTRGHLVLFGQSS